MISKAERIDQIKTLLLKARSESGSTEAERKSCQAMAHRLMKKHSITKEEIVGPPREKPRVEQKTNKYSTSPYATRYAYHNGWYFYDIPESIRQTTVVKNLNIDFANACKGLDSILFQVGNIGAMVRSNHPELLFRYEMELRERIRIRQQREHDESYLRTIREKHAREKAEKEKEDVAFMKKMIMMGSVAVVLMLLIIIL